MIPDTLVECMEQMLLGGHLVPTADQLAGLGQQWLALVPTAGRELDGWAQDVLALFVAAPARHRKRLFWILDGDGPGTGPVCLGYTVTVRGQPMEWHWKLRRVRNDQLWGKRLFDVLERTDQTSVLVSGLKVEWGLAW